MFASIKAIEYALPNVELTNAKLSLQFPEWSVEKISSKTGIESRHIASEYECASDLGVEAANLLFDRDTVRRDVVDFILFCTQSPDYFLPTTACLLQDRLQLPTSAGALDFNLGCSGFVYGLGLAKGLIETGQAQHVLLITAETYSKHMNPKDKSVRTIFGDAAAATYIEAEECEKEKIGIPVYGTDGSGACNLIVPAGGMRERSHVNHEEGAVDYGSDMRNGADLFMNGPEIFTFTLERVPTSIEMALRRAGIGLEDIDLFVFHQANGFMLEHLRKKCGIPNDKFYVSLADVGNTVSSTIPIALKRAQEDGRLEKGMRVMLSGFGVGYSWSTCIIEW